MRIFSFLPTLLVSFIVSSCALLPSQKKFELSDLSPEQLEELNTDALAIASQRLGEMVIQARGTKDATRYLSTDLFLKANMSLLDGDYETASVLFKHLVQLVPDDQFVLKKYSIALIRVGELGSAREVLEKLYQLSNDDKVGLILAGVYSGIDQEEEARKLYRKILASDPSNEDACIFLSKSLAVSKQTSKAVGYLKECSAKNKKNGMYDYYIGKIYLDLGQVPKAMEALKAAYRKQSDLGAAVNTLGILLEEREKHEEAIEIYKKYLARQPNDASVLMRIVQVLFLKERFSEVIPYAERLSDLEPENLNLKVKLGILYTDAKKFTEAISVFKDLLQAAPQSDKILYYLGTIHQELRQYQESIEYFNQIPSNSGLYMDSSVQMATMLSTLALLEHEEKDKGDWKNKFEVFVDAKLKEFNDYRVEFSLIKAGFYEGVGDYKNASEALLSVQNEKSFTTQHKYYLANLLERVKRYEESTAIVMGILEKEPKNAHAWNFLGYTLLERGDEMERAYAYIQKALELNPEDGYIRDSLGWYYFKQGQTEKALRELEFALKKIPQDTEVLKHLAIIHREMKNFVRAKSFLESALKHVRYNYERQEIISQLEELERDRLPASDKND